MLGKLLNDVAGALLTAHASRELIEDVRQERENVRAWMTIFEARARMLRLDRDELACLAEHLDTVLPKLEALERDQHRGSRRVVNEGPSKGEKSVQERTHDLTRQEGRRADREAGG